MAQASKNISWKAEDYPFSEEHQDFFFPEKRALEASEEIFLRACGLPELFEQNRNVAVGELGFGSGLNFFVTAKAWLRRKAVNKTLRFVSFEKSPFRLQDYQRSLQPFQELRPLYEPCLPALDSVLPGFNHFVLFDGSVSLTLCVGDISEQLPELTGKLDAWFLDGFAPARNPEMWSESVFKELARLSKNGTRFSTWAAAGFVRRGLEESGFSCERVKGFDGKRERLEGYFQTRERNQSNSAEIAIIGAGLAGAQLAYSASRYGLKPTVFEQAAAPASGASGNAAGLVYPYFTRKPSPASSLYLNCFGYFHSLLSVLESSGYKGFQRLSALQLLSSERLKKLHEGLSELELPESITKAGLHSQTEQAALLYPNSVVIEPKTFVQKLLELSACNFVNNKRVSSLRESKDGVELEALRSSFDAAVLSNSFAARSFKQFSWLPIEPVRGQLLEGKEQRSAEALCFDGYLIPKRSGGELLGASFDHFKLAAPARAELLSELEAKASAVAPGGESSSGRVSFRCTSVDRLPLCGRVAELAGDTAQVCSATWILSALGSRGFLSSGLLAENLVLEMLELPAALPRSVMEQVSALRFIERAERRGEIDSLSSGELPDHTRKFYLRRA